MSEYDIPWYICTPQNKRIDRQSLLKVYNKKALYMAGRWNFEDYCDKSYIFPFTVTEIEGKLQCRFLHPAEIGKEHLKPFIEVTRDLWVLMKESERAAYFENKKDCLNKYYTNVIEKTGKGW